MEETNPTGSMELEWGFSIVGSVWLWLSYENCLDTYLLGLPYSLKVYKAPNLILYASQHAWETPHTHTYWEVLLTEALILNQE